MWLTGTGKDLSRNTEVGYTYLTAFMEGGFRAFCHHKVNRGDGIGIHTYLTTCNGRKCMFHSVSII